MTSERLESRKGKKMLEWGDGIGTEIELRGNRQESVF